MRNDLSLAKSANRTVYSINSLLKSWGQALLSLSAIIFLSLHQVDGINWISLWTCHPLIGILLCVLVIKKPIDWKWYRVSNVNFSLGEKETYSETDIRFASYCLFIFLELICCLNYLRYSWYHTHLKHWRNWSRDAIFQVNSNVLER